MHRFVRSGVGVMCAFATLAACSSGKADHPATALPPTDTTSDPATVVPPPSTTAASSPSDDAHPSITRPVLSGDGRGDTADGAVAVSRYWLDAYSYAFETGDTKPMQGISAKSCGTCNNYIESISEEVRKGMKYRSTPDRTNHISIAHFAASSAQVHADVTTGQVSLYDPKTGKTTQGSKPRTVSLSISLHWLSTRWSVQDVFLDKK